MEFKTNVPIYLQVIEDMKRKLIAGSLTLGAKLPSSRELALEYEINPNTAARIYNEMEAMGLSYTRRGIGTFVTEDATVIDRLKQEQTHEIVKEFAVQLQDMGYAPEEVLALLQAYYEKSK